MHIMPIFPPIMLCSYAQLLPCHSFPATNYYAHFMLTFAVQIPTKKSKHAPIFVAFGSEIDGSLQSGSEYCDPWLGSSVSHRQTSKK